MVPTRLAVWHASKLTPIMPRAWKSTWLCNWLHAQLPIEHRKFSDDKNQENAICMKIGVCNGSDATCCVARIKTHSNHAASMEIDLALQLAARAAPDRAQEFFG